MGIARTAKYIRKLYTNGMVIVQLQFCLIFFLIFHCLMCNLIKKYQFQMKKHKKLCKLFPNPPSEPHRKRYQLM